MEKASKEKEMFLPPILRTVFPSLTKSGKRIALYIAAHEEEVKRMTLGELAHAIDISEITILRFCKQLGFVGFQELKVELASGRGEATNFLGYDLVEATDTPQQISQKVIANIINGLQDTLQLLDQAALKEAITALFEARQTLILGFGNSATVCRDMETRLMRFGRPVQAISDAHVQATATALLTDEDVVIGISHSGESVELYQSLLLAKNRGATIIVITSHKQSSIAEIADIVLCGVGREVGFSSEASASRFAHFAIGDIIYTGLALLDLEQYEANISLMRDAVGTHRKKRTK